MDTCHRLAGMTKVSGHSRETGIQSYFAFLDARLGERDEDIKESVVLTTDFKGIWNTEKCPTRSAKNCRHNEAVYGVNSPLYWFGWWNWCDCLKILKHKVQVHADHWGCVVVFFSDFIPVFVLQPEFSPGSNPCQ